MMLCIVSAQSFSVILQLVVVLIIVLLGDGATGQVLAVAFLGSTAAVDGNQIGLDVAEAIQSSVQAHVGEAGVNGLNLLFGQLETVLNGQIVDSVGALNVILSLGNKEVSPGLTGFLVVGLLVQGSGGAQQIAEVAAVVLGEGVDSVNVEIVQLNSAQRILTDLHSNGILVDGSLNGVHQQGTGGDGQAKNNNNPKAQSINFQGSCFLVSSILTLSQLLPRFLLAKLFLVGCTHEIISSQIVLWFFTRR